MFRHKQVSCLRCLDVQVVILPSLPGAAGHRSKQRATNNPIACCCVCCTGAWTTCILFVIDSTNSASDCAPEIPEDGCYYRVAPKTIQSKRTHESLQYSGGVSTTLHTTSRDVCQLCCVMSPCISVCAYFAAEHMLVFSAGAGCVLCGSITGTVSTGKVFHLVPVGSFSRDIALSCWMFFSSVCHWLVHHYSPSRSLSCYEGSIARCTSGSFSR